MTSKKMKGLLVLLLVTLIGCLIWVLTQQTSPPVLDNQTGYISPNLSGRKVTVLVTHPQLGAAEAIAKWFNQATGAVVRNVVVNYTDQLDYILKDVSSTNSQLDLFMLWYVDLGKLVESRALFDVTDFIQQNASLIQPNDFISSLYKPYTLYNGRRWALPFDGDTHVLFYRISLLNKYNLKPPKTWDEYLHVAKTITENEKKSGIYGTAIMGVPVPIIVLSSFMNRLGCYGGVLLDSTGKPVVNSVEAVTALSEMVKHGQQALPTPLETNFEVSRDAFLSGKVAMVEQWTDIGIMAEDIRQSVIQGDWGVIQMPMGKGVGASSIPALNAGYSIGISTKTDDLEAAKAYLLFISRPSITLKLNLINGGVDPTRVSVLKSPDYQSYSPKVSMAAQSALNGATAWPTIPQAPQLLEILTQNVIAAMEGQISARQALDDTQKKWEDILDR